MISDFNFFFHKKKKKQNRLTGQEHNGRDPWRPAKMSDGDFKLLLYHQLAIQFIIYICVHWQSTGRCSRRDGSKRMADGFFSRVLTTTAQETRGVHREIRQMNGASASRSVTYPGEGGGHKLISSRAIYNNNINTTRVRRTSSRNPALWLSSF